MHNYSYPAYRSNLILYFLIMVTIKPQANRVNIVFHSMSKILPVYQANSVSHDDSFSCLFKSTKNILSEIDKHSSGCRPPSCTSNRRAAIMVKHLNVNTCLITVYYIFLCLVV